MKNETGVLPELKYLGEHLERSDYARYEYKGYSIVLHLTITGNTRLRLILNEDDEIFYNCICDWCMGENNDVHERFVSDLSIVHGFALMIHCIDTEQVKGMPHHSEPRPIWNDPEFMKWWGDRNKEIPNQLCMDAGTRIMMDVDRADFAKRLVKGFLSL